MGKSLKNFIIIDTPYGFFYCRKNKNDLHIVSPHYEFEILRVFRKLLKNSRTVFDVGAHIGKYAIMSAGLNPSAKVYAFEGFPDNTRVLKINKEINNLHNLEIIGSALSDKIGKEKFYISQTGLMTEKSEKSEFVETETIDNFLQKNKIHFIDLIKIDVDGKEQNVLEGANRSLSQGKIKNIIIEIDINNKKEVIGVLSKNNYSISEIVPNNYLATLNS